MTAQISDKFRYRDKARALAGINGSGLFNPRQYGIQPIMLSTACYRGYYCAYEIADDALFLTEVHLGLGPEDMATAARGEGPKLFGKVPSWDCESVPDTPAYVPAGRPLGDFKVDGLRELVPFKGGLLLGDRFIEEMYIYMEPIPPYKYRVLHELVFDAGRLVEEHDRSAQMAEFREMLIRSRSLEPGAEASLAEIEQWIELGSWRENEQWLERCFSLNYRIPVPPKVLDRLDPGMQTRPPGRLV